MSSAAVIPQGQSLFDLTDHLQAMFDSLDMIDTPELKAEAEREIQAYLEAEIRKVDGVASYLAQCEAQQDLAKAEIARLSDRRALWANREDRVRSYVQRVMENFSLKKLEGNLATFSLRAVPASVIVVDEKEIPDEFKVTTVTISIDKKAIKKAIDAGRDVPGADLSMGKQTLVRK